MAVPAVYSGMTPSRMIKMPVPRGAKLGLRLSSANEVANVAAGSPSEAAGLRIGDVILEVDGASQKSIDKNTDNQLKTITANCSLVVELYDHNLFCDALIGSTEINLTEIFSAGQSLKADERVLQLELSSAYARSTKIPPTVTILLSFAPSKKQKSKRKNRPADTFT